ncbi:MAG TPA: outer membrane protein assembly factor BamC [Methylophilaceae bacterium]|nr:outer membrane protein assembly factor BamC [Methylophilaceae bacterium]
MTRFNLSRTALVCLLAASVSACDSIPFINDAPDYKGAGRSKPLEVPPDLTSISSSDTYSIPGSTTTYSSYSEEQAAQGDTAEKLLPKPDGVRMERAGSQRWLVVDAPAEKIWPIVREFWADLGFAVVTENPQTGVMETEWADPSELEQKQKGNYLDRFDSFLDRLSGLNDRQKYRTRLERGAEPKTTEIYMSHRSISSAPDDGKQRVRTPYGEVEQGYRLDNGKVLKQNDRAVSEDIDAELLRRLMVKLGVSEQKSQQIITTVSNEKHATLDKEKDGTLNLTVNDQFDRAWRRVSLALDRIGFVVEDRDRSKGIFYVRYFDAAPEDKPEDKGLLDKLKFWGDDDKKAEEQEHRPPPKKAKDEGVVDKLKFWKADDQDKGALLYLVKVEEAGDNSRVIVTYPDGKRDNSSTADRIINLLYGQLK